MAAALDSGAFELMAQEIVDPLFIDRKPESAARQLACVLAHATECALATLEYYEGLKYPPAGQVKRHKKICETLVFNCWDLKVTPRGLGGSQCPRLKDAMALLNAVRP